MMTSFTYNPFTGALKTSNEAMDMDNPFGAPMTMNAMDDPFGAPMSMDDPFGAPLKTSKSKPKPEEGKHNDLSIFTAPRRSKNDENFNVSSLRPYNLTFLGPLTHP